MKKQAHAVIIAAFVAAFLVVFLLWPLAFVFKNAFTGSEGFPTVYFFNLFQDRQHLEAIRKSFQIALLTTVCCFFLATPIAWLFARKQFFGKTVFSALLLLPMLAPPFVGAVGMKMIFARGGALSTLLMRMGIVDGPVDWLGAFPLAGIVLLETLHLFPILYLNMTAAFANIDPNLEECAANLGAPPHRVFLRVTLPLAAPGIFAGLILIFIWSFTELGTPLVFGYRRVLPVMIYDLVSEIGSNPTGYAMVVFLLLFTITGFLLSKFLTKRFRNTATQGRLNVSTSLPPLSRFQTAGIWCILIILLFIALLPHFGVIMLAFGRRWFLTVLPEDFTLDFFSKAISMEMTGTALKNSLLYSSGALVINVLVGTAVAWVCVRSKIKGKDLLDAVAMIPLAVPGVVMAFGYLGCFSSTFKGIDILNPRANPVLLLAISYSIRRLPYMVRAVHAGLEQTGKSYEEAAVNLGATPLRAFRRIALPLIAANIIAGGVLCFAFSMLEVSDSLILAQFEEYFPITKAIYNLMESLENGVNVASALGIWATALLTAAILWAGALMGRRLGEMFRAG